MGPTPPRTICCELYCKSEPPLCYTRWHGMRAQCSSVGVVPLACINAELLTAIGTSKLQHAPAPPRQLQLTPPAALLSRAQPLWHFSPHTPMRRATGQQQQQGVCTGAMPPRLIRRLEPKHTVCVPPSQPLCAARIHPSCTVLHCTWGRMWPCAPVGKPHCAAAHPPPAGCFT